MKFIFSRLIIGSIIIIVGFYILLQYILHIYMPLLAYIPIFTIILSFLIISWGVAVIFGKGFYASKITIGIVIILIGIYIFIRYCINVNNNIPFILYVPIFRIIIGFIIIFLGIYILIGKYHYIEYSNLKDKKEKYNFYFKTKIMDLSNLQIDISRSIEIDASFSDITIFINENIKVNICASSAFGNIFVPTGG